MNDTTEKTTRRFGLWGSWFTRGKKIGFAVCANLFAWLTVFFFSPIDVYLGNIMEFDFPFNNVWWILLLTAAAGALVVTLIELVLPEKVFLPVNLLVFGGGLCCYVQAAFLNFRMGTLTGENDIYSTKVVVADILAWVLLLLAVYVFVYLMARFGKRALAVTALMFVSLALVAMQTVSFVTLLATTNTDAFQKGSYLTSEGEFEVSNDTNVVEFIVDTCDVRFFNATLAQYPDMTDKLAGFTCYPNMTSTHSRTYPSVPYLLTGQICYFDKPITKYVDEAWQAGTFVPDMKQAQCDVRLFTESLYVSSEAKQQLGNSASFQQNLLKYISVPGLIKEMTRISLYKEMPYFAKARFAYTGNSVNRTVSMLPSPAIEESDAYYYEQLTEQRLRVSDEYDKAFRFYHFAGSHPGATLTADATEGVASDVLAATRGNFHIIEEYLAQLQALGLYEKTTIIITADHGRSGGTDNLEVDEPYRPILLVKPAGVGADAPYTVSQAPVCHADLFATVLTGLGADAAAYGRPVWEIPENEARDRYYYYTALVSDEEGEVALREYLVRGDAANLANWSLTGRNWDVNYSERAVSRRRLAEWK